MPISNAALERYRKTLEAALTHGKVRIQFATEGKALNYAQYLRIARLREAEEGSDRFKDVTIQFQSNEGLHHVEVSSGRQN